MFPTGSWMGTFGPGWWRCVGGDGRDPAGAGGGMHRRWAFRAYTLALLPVLALLRACRWEVIRELAGPAAMLCLPHHHGLEVPLSSLGCF